MFLVSSCSCLCLIHWSQVLSWEWRYSWSSADRRCSNYIWMINNFLPTKVRLILETLRYVSVANLSAANLVPNYSNVIMSVMSSEITSLTIVCSTVNSGADQRKHKSSGEFSAQRSSNAENVSIWWRHHELHTNHITCVKLRLQYIVITQSLFDFS